MSITTDTTATLYRDDPQYIDGYGTPGIQLNSNDAYVEIEEIPFDKILEKTQFELKCIERRKNGTPILPIREELGLDFKYMEAYGFLFPVLNVEIESREDRTFKLTLEFDPAEIGNRVMITIPITARHIGGNRIELERTYEHEMPKPFCLRGKHTQGNKIIKLNRESPGSSFFTVVSKDVKLLENERVQVLTNWNPSAIQTAKNNL
jgi:hypothetical protein